MKSWIKYFLMACLLSLGMAANAQTSPDYRLGAGDSIGVQVYQSPDLSLESRVSESGAISYPLIGNVQLGGLSLA
jgi:polysaccharide export outer membrane protein